MCLVANANPVSSGIWALKGYNFFLLGGGGGAEHTCNLFVPFINYGEMVLQNRASEDLPKGKCGTSFSHAEVGVGCKKGF